MTSLMIGLDQSILSDDFLHGISKLNERYGAALQLLFAAGDGEDALVGEQVKDDLMRLWKRKVFAQLGV